MLLEGKVGAAVSGLSSGSSEGDTRPCLLEEPGFVSVVPLILANGGQGLGI